MIYTPLQIKLNFIFSHIFALTFLSVQLDFVKRLIKDKIIFLKLGYII